jgi:glycosyltransferase involved in cell wall biosynthesis
MPSLYEGSALPSLEALANHVPVISSQKTCLPEILQGAARYFDPEDTSEIVKAIHEGINNEEFREMSVEIGQKVCSSYSWKTTASITLEIYKKNQK